MSFEIAHPSSVDEALMILDPEDPTIRPFAGGTGLMLMMKSGIFLPSKLVVLRGIEGLSGIEAGKDGSIRLGALTTLAELELSDLLADNVPVLVNTLHRLSNRRVRNSARLGGALAHADPHMDLPPLLSALQAKVEIEGRGGSRTLPVEELVTGYYENALEPNELITSVVIPSQENRRSAYRKFTARSADDWPALAVAVSMEKDGNTRLFAGAATEKLVRLAEAEAVLAEEGRSGISRAAEAAADNFDPMDDAHGSSGWKRTLLRVELARALSGIMGDIQ